MIGFIKRHKILTGLAALILASAFFMLRGEPEVLGDFAVAARADVAQEVELTGRVEPAEKVLLSAESSGKVAAVPAEVGQPVSAGDLLVSIEDDDLRIRLQRQQLALEKAELALQEAQKWPKLSESLDADHRVSRALEAKQESEEDLAETLESGYNSVSDAFLDLPSALVDLDRLLSQSYLSNNLVSAKYGKDGLAERDRAWDAFYLADRLFDEVFDEYKGSSRDSDPAAIQDLIRRTYELSRLADDALRAANNFLDFIEDENSDATPPSALAGDQEELDDLARTVNSHLAQLLAAKNGILDAERGITDAERDIAEARENASEVYIPDEFEIANLQLDAGQARLDVEETRVALDKRSIRSPIDGVVTDVAARRGELISPGSPAVSVISAADYQISANLPEIDLAKVRPGLRAQVTLDPYGPEALFEAVVTSVSPAEVMVDGVPVYEVILQFVHDDERYRSGLTADVVVFGEVKKDALAVPARAVIQKNGASYLRILENGQVTERRVRTGLRGSTGNIEILEGLSEGEEVLVYSQD